MQDYKKTLISQYANSPTINQLMESMNGYIDPGVFLDEFYTHIWDIETASRQGLNIWGKIVGIKRALTTLPEAQCFGFNEANSSQPFDQAPFYSAEQNYQRELEDDEYRTLIKIKALSNISGTSAPSLNKILRQLFPDLPCYVLDVGNMQIIYVFEFALTSNQYEILTQSGILPKPAGVQVNILQIPDGDVFGFDESGYCKPFDVGTFLNSIISI